MTSLFKYLWNIPKQLWIGLVSAVTILLLAVLAAFMGGKLNVEIGKGE